MRNVLTAIVFFSLIAIILLVNTGCAPFDKAVNTVRDDDFSVGCVFVIEKVNANTGAIGVAAMGANLCKLKCSPIDQLPPNYRFKGKNDQAGCEGSVGYEATND